MYKHYPPERQSALKANALRFEVCHLRDFYGKKSKKLKFALEQDMRAQRAGEVLLYYFFNLGARYGWVVDATSKPQDRSGQMRKVSPPPRFSLSLCLYFFVLALPFVLSVQHTHNRKTSMPPAVFEHTIPASDRPQTFALDLSATGIGRDSIPRPCSP